MHEFIVFFFKYVLTVLLDWHLNEVSGARFG